MWPPDLESRLADCWSQAEPAIFKLTVLSRQDVLSAAEAHEFDANEFSAQLTHAEAHALAAIPVTLLLLLTTYERDASLPNSRVELYQGGCRHLCEAVHRRGSFETTDTTVEQRFKIAERLAALTLLGDREGIDATSYRAEATSNNLHIDDALDYWEEANGRHFDVTDRYLRETLSTGLFSTVDDTYFWVHRTFQEYLAAAYLTEGDLSSSDILELISVTGTSGPQIAPQLRDFAGWLASLHPGFKQRILEIQPLYLLSSDTMALSDEDRRRIVDWLIDAANDALYVRRPGEQQLYRKLNYDGLAAQLAPVLQGNVGSLHTQQVAVDIIEQCELLDLRDLLVSVALDPSRPLVMRRDAAWAIAQVGDPDNILQLKPLLNDPCDDGLQQLRSAALGLLWPEHLSASELFQVLVPRGDVRAIDFYHRFVRDSVLENLQVEVLPTRWIGHVELRPIYPMIANFPN